MQPIVLVVNNLRSAHNVGSLLRTAEGLGIQKVYLAGYTPYPESPDDERLPHLRQKISRQIHKTALGAEGMVEWQHVDDIKACLEALGREGYLIAALEQTDRAVNLADFRPSQPVALIIGNELEGIDKQLLDKSAVHLRIPMRGQKESFNVAAAAAMALYHLSNLDKPGA